MQDIKNVSQLQQQLKKVKRLINEEKPVEVQTIVPDNAVEIDKSVFLKMKMLARFYKKEPTDLINEALSHYLRLKKLDIDEALSNMVVGDDEE